MPLILCLLCWLGVWLISKYEMWSGAKRKEEHIKRLKDMGIDYYQLFGNNNKK